MKRWQHQTVVYCCREGGGVAHRLYNKATIRRGQAGLTSARPVACSGEARSSREGDTAKDTAVDHAPCLWQGEKVRLRPLRLDDAETRQESYAQESGP
jgi:hypothetical protein